MHSHPIKRRHDLVNRQTELLNTPTVSGLLGVSTGVLQDADANTLALDTDAAAATNAGNVQLTAIPTETFTSPFEAETTSSDPSSDSTDTTSTTAQQDSGKTDEISLGTVIGACLGALAGAVILILLGLLLYKRGTRPRPRRPSNARGMVDKERAWAKMDDDEDKWDGKDGGKYQQKGVVSVGPTMEKLTMFKTATPSIRTVSQSGDDTAPAVEPFSHPFAQYHPNLAKQLATQPDEPPRRPFLARVDPIPPMSWDGDTVARDSFLSFGSNHAMSPGVAIPTPQLTSSEPHHWESAVVMEFDQSEAPRGRSPANDDDNSVPHRKSGNNPFFGASPRMSVHSTRSSRSVSRSRTPSISGASRAASIAIPDPETMPMPPPSAYTREEKGKYRAATPPSPASSRAPSTILAHGSAADDNNPFSHPADRESAFVLPPPSIVHTPHHSQGAQGGSEAQERALASLLAALGPAANAEAVQDRLRVASMNPSIVSAESQYTETDADTLHQSWPVPPRQS
ncbi:hypothetical protein MKEN_00370100 [Mycena kentingensis (nom. inval.)]|nr:hypothetical protein MKEN_00370100 [Mycena kentingensis (nom. inval.)]